MTDNTKPGNLSGLTDFTDTELESYIEHYRSELTRFEHEQTRRQSEQEARDLEPFWKNNPGLQFVRDDPLLITEYASQSEIHMDWHIGDTCKVGTVNGMDSGLVYICGDGFGTPISLELARHMRSAYLQLVAHESEGNR